MMEGRSAAQAAASFNWFIAANDPLICSTDKQNPTLNVSIPNDVGHCKESGAEINRKPIIVVEIN
jgi:hypothetical protein